MLKLIESYVNVESHYLRRGRWWLSWRLYRTEERERLEVVWVTIISLPRPGSQLAFNPSLAGSGPEWPQHTKCQLEDGTWSSLSLHQQTLSTSPNPRVGPDRLELHTSVLFGLDSRWEILGSLLVSVVVWDLDMMISSIQYLYPVWELLGISVCWAVGVRSLPTRHK